MVSGEYLPFTPKYSRYYRKFVSPLKYLEDFGSNQRKLPWDAAMPTRTLERIYRWGTRALSAPSPTGLCRTYQNQIKEQGIKWTIIIKVHWKTDLSPGRPKLSPQWKKCRNFYVSRALGRTTAEGFQCFTFSE